MKLFRAVNDYSKMIKLSHSLFALPFAGIGLVQALLLTEAHKNDLFYLTGLITICMVSARSAAMGMNRLADRYYDRQNPRTAGREIPSGKLSPFAVSVFIILSSVIFIFSSLALNRLSFFLSFPALGILFLYSFSKRFTWFCHFILGISIGFAPVGAWIGVTGQFDLLPFVWFGGLLFQIAGFDILYAMQDMEADRKLELFSIPSRFGFNVSFNLALITFFIAIALFVYAGILSGFGAVYYSLLLVTGIIMALEFRISFKAGGTLLPPLFYQLNSYISILIFTGVLIESRSALMEKFL